MSWTNQGDFYKTTIYISKQPNDVGLPECPGCPRHGDMDFQLEVVSSVFAPISEAGVGGGLSYGKMPG